MAWLNAIPEKQPGEQKLTRREIIQSKDENHAHLSFPPLDSHGHLIDWFFDVGPVLYGGMGPTPLSFSEISAWGKPIGLTAWESSVLRSLSVTYVSMQQKADKQGCPPPFVQELSEDSRKLLSDRLGAALRSLIKPTSKGLKATKVKK